jgi:hypothetical protein
MRELKISVYENISSRDEKNTSKPSAISEIEATGAVSVV